jgi:hypothetical protein
MFFALALPVSFRSIRQAAVLIVVLGVVTGCSEPKGNIGGKVIFDGSPLPSGKVTFICEGGDKPVLMADIRDGKYELKGLPVGPVKITVATYKPSPKVDRPPGLGPTRRPDTDDMPPVSPEKFVAIPVRYSQAETSGLTYTVKPGDQEYDIPLAP